MGLAEPLDEDGSGGETGSEEGLDEEQYEWLQRQLAHIGHLRIADDGAGGEGDESEWADPSGGVLLNILAACEDGDAAKLRGGLADLAATQHSIDTPGPDGDTALHLACLYGHAPCVEVLLDAGASASAVNPDDATSPLHDAAAGATFPSCSCCSQRRDRRCWRCRTRTATQPSTTRRAAGTWLWLSSCCSRGRTPRSATPRAARQRRRPTQRPSSQRWWRPCSSSSRKAAADAAAGGGG